MAAVVLAVVLATGATDLLHINSTDICDLLPEVHDASAHRWTAEADRTDTPHQHCYLCQWLRSLGSSPELTSQLTAANNSSDRVRMSGVLPDTRQIASRLPARSPPL
jgi:hypothetical protein